MLVGAFFGIFIADKSGNLFVALAAAVLAGVALAAVHALAAITFRADQIVSGMALNILALGLTSYLNYEQYGTTGTPADLPSVPAFTVPVVSGLPFVGDVLGRQNTLLWVMFLLVIVLQLFLFRTVPGLRLRAVGEHPRAADTVGIDVRRTRYWAVLASGAFAALGGVYLSMAVSGSFTDNMTNGRGFIGLAAMIFGRWTPVGALVASTDSRGRTVFHFNSLPKDTALVMDSDVSSNTSSEVSILEANGSVFAEQVHLSVRPTRLKLIMKLDQYESTARYRIGPEGKPLLVEHTADMTGSGMGQEGKAHTVATYSDYRAIK